MTIGDAMRPLRNYKREIFCKDIANDVEPAVAYVNAGFAAHRGNCFRLMKRDDVAARIKELRQQREDLANAARQPPDQILSSLDNCGIVAVADFFERDAAGILRPRDLQKVRPEIAIGLLKAIREATNINQPV